MRPGAAVALMALAACVSPSIQAQPTQATHADSGWVSLFDGKDFGDAFYVYKGGYVSIASQTTFKIENGMIHAGGPYALLVTAREYGFYRLRVEYRFGDQVGGGANAGMMILVDNAGARATGAPLRPRSIEINCRRDTGYPWTLWASSGLGPRMQTTVANGSAKFLARAEGGVDYVVDPSGNRVLESSYANPELPAGQWNRGEAEVYGDSGVFTLNGRLRTASWKWTAKSVRTARGGIGVQSEGSEIWYRGWEIQELDSATLLPVHARRGCTDRSKPGYDPRAVVSEGSCAASGVVRAGNRARGARSPGLRGRDAAGRARTASR